MLFARPTSTRPMPIAFRDLRAFTLALCFSGITALGCSGGGSDGENGDGSQSGDFNIDACSAIGARLIGPKLIGGEQCGVDSDVSIARLNIALSNGSEVLCTGTVIDSNAVLTAGHCFAGLGVTAVGVDAGVQSVSANRIEIHPGYSENFGVGAVFNDVAVVFTSQSLDEPRVPLLLSRSAQVGEEAVVTGYGTRDDGSFGELFAGNATVTDVTANHVSTAFTGVGSNPCTGDSGGPLLVDAGGVLAIAGVVSTGNADVENCGPGDVTLYANLDNSSINSFVLDLVPNALTR